MGREAMTGEEEGRGGKRWVCGWGVAGLGLGRWERLGDFSLEGKKVKDSWLAGTSLLLNSFICCFNALMIYSGRRFLIFRGAKMRVGGPPERGRTDGTSGLEGRRG